MLERTKETYKTSYVNWRINLRINQCTQSKATCSHCHVYNLTSFMFIYKPGCIFDCWSKPCAQIKANYVLKEHLSIILILHKSFHLCVLLYRSRNLQCQRIFQVNAPCNCVCLHPNQASMKYSD